MSKYIVQSVILKKEKFTQREAERWIKENDYKLTLPDITQHYYRFRQVDPKMLHHFRFREVALGDIGYLVVAYPNKSAH